MFHQAEIPDSQSKIIEAGPFPGDTDENLYEIYLPDAVATGDPVRKEKKDDGDTIR